MLPPKTSPTWILIRTISLIQAKKKTEKKQTEIKTSGTAGRKNRGKMSINRRKKEEESIEKNTEENSPHPEVDAAFQKNSLKLLRGADGGGYGWRRCRPWSGAAGE